LTEHSESLPVTEMVTTPAKSAGQSEIRARIRPNTRRSGRLLTDERDCGTMTFEKADDETRRRRDAEVARLRSQRVPFRVIAERLGMSLGAVQKAVQRSQRLAVAVATGDPDFVTELIDIDIDDDDGPAEPLTISRSEQIARLLRQLGQGDREMDDLVMYRLRHLMSGPDLEKLYEIIGPSRRAP
jgi:hypothetical protein